MIPQREQFSGVRGSKYRQASIATAAQRSSSAVATRGFDLTRVVATARQFVKRARNRTRRHCAVGAQPGSSAVPTCRRVASCAMSTRTPATLLARSWAPRPSSSHGVTGYPARPRPAPGLLAITVCRHAAKWGRRSRPANLSLGRIGLGLYRLRPLLLRNGDVGETLIETGTTAGA